MAPPLATMQTSFHINPAHYLSAHVAGSGGLLSTAPSTMEGGFEDLARFAATGLDTLVSGTDRNLGFWTPRAPAQTIAIPVALQRNPFRVAERIWDSLGFLRQPSPSPEFERILRSTTIAKLSRLVREGAPIAFVFPGFPAKSPNHATKVLGPHPDLGEKLALERLDRLVTSIGRHYAPGAEICVVSDGRIFADAVGLPDESIDVYLNSLRRMCPCPSIRFVTIDEFYPGLSPQAARAAFLAKYAPTESEIRASIASSEERLRLYLGFTVFRMEDRPPAAGLSKNQIQKIAKMDAIRMIQCNDASARFIQATFPDKIRLSIHPQSSNPHKVGINLLPSTHVYSGTPWHCVAVVKLDGSIALMKKREAEEAGFELIYKNGRPHHYAETFVVPN